MNIDLKEDIIKTVREQITECCRMLDGYQKTTGVSDFEEVSYKLKNIISPKINDLSIAEIRKVEKCFSDLANELNKHNHQDFVRYVTWLVSKLELQMKSIEQELQRKKHEKKHHPVRPRRGEIYLAELGQNVGKEINSKHLVIIFQNTKGNIYSNTTVVIPISSSGKLYDSHEKIEEKDIKSGKLDKLPCKAKTEQILFVDKARLIHKVAELETESENNIMRRIAKRLKENLDID